MATKKNKSKIAEVAEAPLNTALVGGSGGELVVNPSKISEVIVACDKVGATDEHLIKTLYEATLATKTIFDKYGESYTDADHDKRIKGAMALLELKGIIKNKAIANDNSKHTHVTYSWQPVQVINTDSSGRINVD